MKQHQLQQLLQLLHFLLVAKITSGSTTQNARQPTPLHQENGSVTNLDRVTLLLIGKALDGTESVPVLGPRFQHHPPKKITVELLLLDGSVEVLHQDWVKP